jgi:serine/threonine-protein kinase
MSGLKSNLRMGRQIGSGHFGDVYLAEDPVHGKVAVKVLRQNAGESDAEWRQRKDGLLMEGQRLKQATHNNVVQVHHLPEAESGNAILLVMEYCCGGSLQKHFEDGPLLLTDVRKLSTEVALGLQALHSRGMLHRDIKPGNLLLDGQGVAKLGDFGLVTDNIILGYASQVGYLDHISPEVWNGSGTSVRSDIWALGMTIYRLLHGLEWYSSSPAPRMVVRDGEFADTLRWLPHVPKRWRRVVRKMLRDDPTKRYQNTNQIVNALATLPVEPKWKCTVTALEVRWERQTKGRRMIVVWTKHSARRHEWKAWSEPIGAGRLRFLGGSAKMIGYADVQRQLQDFFNN